MSALAKPLSKHIPFVYDDGGRSGSGRKGRAGDCVCRAISIATGRPYSEIFAELTRGNKRSSKKVRTVSHGVCTSLKWFKEYMRSLGFVWVPCMGLGTGCK